MERRLSTLGVDDETTKHPRIQAVTWTRAVTRY
jgi:hypothetical protein